jgi:cysteine desulfurase / selenocysteine lyase
MTEIDIKKLREDTPGCTDVIHFNNAGAGLMPKPVLDATTGMLELEARIGGYEAADAWGDKLEHTYDAIAKLINADSRDEIAVIENATRAFDMAFYSIPFKPGDKILTSVSEYASNVISYLQVCQKTGAMLEVVPNDQHGQMSVDALKTMIDDDVKLISLSHIPTNGGLVQPVEEIGEVAREAGVLYMVDACQSVGQVPVDVQKLGCDMLAATSRKYLRGPRGTGFLYVRKPLIEELEPVLLDLHAATWVAPDRYEIRKDARRFENWETNFAGKVGLGVACDYAMDVGIEAGSQRLRVVAANLR